MQRQWQMTPITLGMLATLSALIGALLSTGLWAGGLERGVEEHERRMNVQEQRVERLEQAIFDIRLELSRIANKLDRIERIRDQ